MNRVIACVDRGPRHASVCLHAAWAADRLQMPLDFLHAVDRHSETVPVRDLSGALEVDGPEVLLASLSSADQVRARQGEQQGRAVLADAQIRAAGAGVDAARLHLRHGALIDGVLDLESEARLFVVGQHPHAAPLGRPLVDHNVEQVVRTVRCPVLVAGEVFRAPRGFLLAFDGSPAAHTLVEHVSQSPVLAGLACALVMVGAETEPGRAQLAWAEAVLSAAGFEVTSATPQGEAAAALLDHLTRHDLDLLVMGAYGHGRLRSLILGSTTTAILRRSPRPVLVKR